MNELPLKDIHLPEASLWWPPAIGWWLLLIVALILICSLPYLLPWLRSKPLKTHSHRELARIRDQRLDGVDEQRLCRDISILLRRTVISYCGRKTAASINGEDWVEQLKQLSGQDCFSAEQNAWLSTGQYQASASCDLDAMLTSCEKWIKALPRRRSDVAD